MCRLPVTFGGGMTMQNGCACARSGRPARNAPVASQSAETRDFDRGSVKRFVHHGIPVRAAPAGPADYGCIAALREPAGRRRRPCAAPGLSPTALAKSTERGRSASRAPREAAVVTGRASPAGREFVRRPAPTPPMRALADEITISGPRTPDSRSRSSRDPSRSAEGPRADRRPRRPARSARGPSIRAGFDLSKPLRPISWANVTPKDGRRRTPSSRSQAATPGAAGLLLRLVDRHAVPRASSGPVFRLLGLAADLRAVVTPKSAANSAVIAKRPPGRRARGSDPGPQGRCRAL